MRSNIFIRAYYHRSISTQPCRRYDNNKLLVNVRRMIKKILYKLNLIIEKVKRLNLCIFCINIVVKRVKPVLFSVTWV